MARKYLFLTYKPNFARITPKDNSRKLSYSFSLLIPKKIRTHKNIISIAIIVLLVSFFLIRFSCIYLFINDVIIESITIGQEIEKKGITTDLVGNLIYSNLQNILNYSTDTFQKAHIKNIIGVSDLQVITGNIKLNNILNFIRDLFGIPKTSLQCSVILNDKLEMVVIITKRDGTVFHKSIYSEKNDIKESATTGIAGGMMMPPRRGL